MAARKILIVEDEVIIAETIRRDLISLGYQVVDSVLSGEDAVQSAWQYRPDLVLMDIVLQGEMDGLVAAEKIQKELNIPVVFLTANSDRNTAEKVKNTRPYGYLLKPFQQSELYTAIETGLYKHQTETALRESERWLTATLDHINDGVVSVDADGKVVLWNPVAELLTGFRRRAALGKSLSSLIHLTCATSGKFFPLSAAGINDLSRELKGEGLLYVGKRDGIPVEASLTPIRISSSLKGAVLVLRDLRERIDAARSLQESQKANLELQQRILEVQKMDSIGRLAGGIAHDFNNILTSIYGYAAFMRSTIATNHEFYSFLHSIENSAQRASDLTSKLLGFARKGGYEIRDIAVDQVIEDVLRVIEPQLPPNIHLEVDLDKTHPVVSADSPQLQRVLVYLCDNAREAMPAGGTLRIETRIVELESAVSLNGDPLPPGSYVQLRISDTGKGIVRENLQRIFEPFFSTKPASAGAGLGLSMAYGVVRGLGGIIDVESEIGQGTTLIITLREVDLPEPEENDGIEVPVRLPGGTENVLVVDDEESVRSFLKDVLTQFGYQVFTSEDGKSALEFYRSGGDGVDLVILDMVMPGMSGQETLVALKELNPAVRVLISTGHTDPRQVQETLAAGAAGFIAKPYTLQDFLMKVRQIIEE